MPPNTIIDFSDAHQDRSKKTLEDLLEAAYNIVEAAEPMAFNSRNLSDKSGYALGTLNKRLGPIENVFVWAIEKGRERMLNNVIEVITQFDPLSPIHVFAAKVVDEAFNAIETVGPSVMRYYEGKVIKRDGFIIESLNFTDVFVEPYLAMVNANRTNTFRKISHEEARLLLKVMQNLVERPFINDDTIAGTPEHRRISIDGLIRILGQ